MSCLQKKKIAPLIQLGGSNEQKIIIESLDNFSLAAADYDNKEEDDH